MELSSRCKFIGGVYRTGFKSWRRFDFSLPPMFEDDASMSEWYVQEDVNTM